MHPKFIIICLYAESQDDAKSVISATTGLKRKVGSASKRAESKKKTGAAANQINATEVFSWGCDLAG